MTSDWRERSNKRRDERQTKVEVEVIRTPARKKRDTKTWCRGNIGVPHKPVCVGYDEHKNVTFDPAWRLLICEVCEKELDRYWPSRWMTKQPPKPDWVTR